VVSFKKRLLVQNPLNIEYFSPENGNKSNLIVFIYCHQNFVKQLKVKITEQLKNFRLKKKFLPFGIVRWL
jgi:hypothetical protein